MNPYREELINVTRGNTALSSADVSIINLEELMRKSIVAVVVAIFTLAFLTGCDSGELDVAPVVIKLFSGLDAGAVLSSSRSISAGQSLDSISSYRVVFKKVELGNSETDRFTLWESVAGEEKDIAQPVTFDSVQPVVPGTYNYIRLTIGDTLEAGGSVTDPDDGTVYNGTGTCVLDGTVFLWGTDIPTVAGEWTIRSPVTIDADTSLFIQFDIDGTVAYSGGPADDATFSVTKPVLNLLAQ